LCATICAKEVQCSCPTVSAEGYGNTSCTAHESGNMCRVEFNDFSEASLGRALAVFNAASVDLRRPPNAQPGMPSIVGHAMALNNLPDKERAQVVLLYMGVAASRSSRFGP